MNKSTTPNIKSNAVKKTAIFFATTLLVMVSTFSFAVLYHEDSVERFEFSLLNQKGETTTEKELAGRHMLVTFGYSSCPDICTPQLQKLSRIMEKLEESGKDNLVKPVFITVDPERDTPERLDEYLTYFHESVVGLTGPRKSIKKVTKFFSTLLPEPPKQVAAVKMNHDSSHAHNTAHDSGHGAIHANGHGSGHKPQYDYLVSHSSMIYIVDPYGRIVDHISYTVKFDEMVKKVKSII